MSNIVRSPRNYRKIKKVKLRVNSSIGDPNEVLEQIYKGEELKFLRNAKNKIRTKTEREELSCEIKEVVSNIYKTEAAKLFYAKLLIPKVKNILGNDNLKQCAFKDTAVRIDNSQKPQERLRSFGKDPNAFYVYKQRSGFVNIADRHKPTKKKVLNINIKISRDIPRKISLTNKLLIAPNTTKPVEDTNSIKLSEKLNITSVILPEIKTENEEKRHKKIKLYKNIKNLLHDPRKMNYYYRKYHSPHLHSFSSQKTENEIKTLETFIEKCENEERKAGMNLKKSEEHIKVACEVANIYKEVSKKVDEIGVVSPNVLKELYLEKQKEEEEDQIEMKGIIYKFKNTVTGKNQYKNMYPIIKPLKKTKKNKESSI